ncbi:MAG: hypothetical protein WC490_02410 [Candidatus Margulisiibacteriota bacterium]
MKLEELQYLKWIIDEFNEALSLNPFTRTLHSPIEIKDVLDEEGNVTQPDRLFVASQIYRWIMGGKWRILDLEKLLKRHKEKFDKKRIKSLVKDLIENQQISSADSLKLCLLLTGIRTEIIDNAKYVLRKKAFRSASHGKLWSSIGYYDMKDRSIHVSTEGMINKEKVVFPAQDVIETAAHELGHHIYISLLTKQIKAPQGAVRSIRKIVRYAKVSHSRNVHEHWLKFYKKDYSREWETNKTLQIIPKEVYIRYGIESELFAQIISGKTTVSKAKRKQIVDLINLGSPKA